MPQVIDPPSQTFIDRRGYDPDRPSPARERRQFVGSYEELSPEGQTMARAIDEYKLRHRRRFITYDEMLGVLKDLGYRQEVA